MKRFTFRLQRVVTVRQIERDRALGEWSAARTRQVAVEEQVEQVGRAASAESAGLVLAGGTVDLRAAAFRSGLRAQALVHARQQLSAADLEVEERAATLRHAAREVDALARLEAHQREAWQVEVRREEARTTDDIATTRSARAGGRAVGGQRGVRS